MMKIHFLGGAAEVGASCVLVEFGTRRVRVKVALADRTVRDELEAQFEQKTGYTLELSAQ